MEEYTRRLEVHNLELQVRLANLQKAFDELNGSVGKLQLSVDNVRTIVTLAPIRNEIKAELFTVLPEEGESHL